MSFQGRQVFHEMVGHALVGHVIVAHRVAPFRRGRGAWWFVRNQRRNASTPPTINPQAMIKNARFWPGCQAPVSLLLLKFSMMRTWSDRTLAPRKGLFNLAQSANRRLRVGFSV